MIFEQRYIRGLLPVAILIFLSAASTNAQRKDFNYKFIAKITDADSANAIKGCHVINKTMLFGTVSDDHGRFTITANVKDSIMFSAIGYEKLTIAVHDSMYTDNRIVKLKPIAYELDEIDIGALSTYEQFRRDAMNAEIKKPNFKIDPISKLEVSAPLLPNQGGIKIPGLGSPVSFFYSLMSKEGKQQRYFLSVINETADHIIIGNKFNGLIVHQLTGLEDDELVEFMSSCMFTKTYLLLATPSEINRAVIQKYREYIKTKKEDE